jgi:hypothetical protein
MRRTLALAVLISATVASAANPPLEEARAHLDKLEYPEASRALELALEISDNDRETLLAIYELKGVIAGTLKQPQEASDAFRAMLSIDPSRKLQAKYPPRVTTPFFEAKSWVAEHGSISLTREPPLDRDGRIARIAVSLTDPLHLATAVRFTWLAGGKRHTDVVVVKGPGAAIDVDGAQLQWTASLLALRDGVLKELGSDAQPLEELAKTRAPVASTPEPVAQPPPPEPGQRQLFPRSVESTPPPLDVQAKPSSPSRTRFWIPAAIVLGAGIALGAAGVAFGVQSRADYLSFDDARMTNGFADAFTRQQALDTLDRAASSAVKANVLFGIGGGLMVVGAVALLVDVLLGDGT